jgi:hypothetical protein
MAFPTAPALLPAAPLRLTTEEVRLLWSFVHGAVQIPSMRAWMRASLGFCPRHTWGYAVVEIELWEAGVAHRAGHVPFDVSVLYEDLAHGLAARLARPRGWGRRPDAVLTPSRPCLLCSQLASPPPEGFAIGYANSSSAALAAEANPLRHTRRWCSLTADVWSPRACGECLGRPAPAVTEAHDGGGPCRLHLASALRAGTADDGDLAAAAVRLAGVADRLAVFADSVTMSGPSADASDEVSWIEALGFFAGWRFPAFLAGLVPGDG